MNNGERPMKICGICGESPAMLGQGRCSPCNKRFMREYRARLRASAQDPCPINAAMRAWLLPFSQSTREVDPCSAKILQLPQRE